MLDLTHAVSIYLFLGKTDMRKGVNGLSIAVQTVLNKDPFSNSLFVFPNRRRTTIKILYYDRNGFCLWYKRLEEDKFIMPKTVDETVNLTNEELKWLLSGLDFRTAHKERHYSHVV